MFAKVLVIVFTVFLGLTVAYKWPHCAEGRSAIVHLFEWKWTDIEAECKRFLGPKGYCGVQISPPNEHSIFANQHPWWQRYQPVSYNLNSRSGNEAQFRKMVETCNNNGVRIYVDAIINHMAASGTGSSGGCSFNPGTLSYPCVPYGGGDFNDCTTKCRTSDCTIHDYNNPEQVRNCRLVHLRDLDQSKDYVRTKIKEFMNKAIDIGVAGFRVDACKHMWPGDISRIFSGLHNLNSRWFGSGSRPFIAQEVIDLGGEPIKGTEYTGTGRVTEFKYGGFLGRVFRKKNNQKLKYLKSFGQDWGMLWDGNALVFIDNHDNQRGHGAGGADILSHKVPKMYKMATAFMLAWPYGLPRLMSSFSFSNTDEGPPHNGDWSTKTVRINADGTCNDGWVCEHRWRQIYNMVAFRNAVQNQGVANWWDNGNNQIAFSRGNAGFLAINNDDGNMGVTLNTGLPAGQYCDVISGSKDGGRCTGKTISVGGDGRAWISLNGADSDPVLAIHRWAKL